MAGVSLGRNFLNKVPSQTHPQKLSNRRERRQTKTAQFFNFKSAQTLFFFFGGKFLKVGCGEETFFKKFPPRKTFFYSNKKPYGSLPCGFLSFVFGEKGQDAGDDDKHYNKYGNVERGRGKQDFFHFLFLRCSCVAYLL
jgi:hypothetical protein